MPVNRTVFSIIVISLVLIQVRAQNYIGITAGIGAGRLFDLTNDPGYETKYHFRGGESFGVFYEEYADSTKKYRLKFELYYLRQNADMETREYGNITSSYSNLHYTFQKLLISGNYSFQLIHTKKSELSFLAAPILLFTLKTHSWGNGSYSSVDVINNKYVPVTKNWVEDDAHSKYVSFVNIGISVGLDLLIPVNQKVDLIAQNKYTVMFSGALLFTSYVTVGMRYHL